MPTGAEVQALFPFQTGVVEEDPGTGCFFQILVDISALLSRVLGLNSSREKVMTEGSATGTASGNNSESHFEDVIQNAWMADGA